MRNELGKSYFVMGLMATLMVTAVVLVRAMAEPSPLAQVWAMEVPDPHPRGWRSETPES